MSEYINNSRKRVDELKRLILALHKGKSADETKKELTDLMGSVPYGEVVQAEEELIQEGLEREEVLKFCDIHTEALKGNIDTSNAQPAPEGHPVDVFLKENNELRKVISQIRNVFTEIAKRNPKDDGNSLLKELHGLFNSIMDIEKHYVRKENLIFPFLEKNDITGPPMVMWGKHDEIRSLLKSCFPLFVSNPEVDSEAVDGFRELMFEPTIKAIEDMFYKEEQILFPMCMDTLTELEWYEIDQQSEDIGFCLYYPEKRWKPETVKDEKKTASTDNRIKLSTGSFKPEELEAMLSSLPVDFTFVDKEDKVRFFSHGKDRIFQRSKTILGRAVQYCHPPSSVHIVNQIVDDFKSGKQDAAKFWIKMGDKYVHIAYFAVRGEEGEYLGTVELSQDIQEYRDIEGERRILEYD